MDCRRVPIHAPEHELKFEPEPERFESKVKMLNGGNGKVSPCLIKSSEAS